MIMIMATGQIFMGLTLKRSGLVGGISNVQAGSVCDVPPRPVETGSSPDKHLEEPAVSILHNTTEARSTQVHGLYVA